MTKVKMETKKVYDPFLCKSCKYICENGDCIIKCAITDPRPYTWGEHLEGKAYRDFWGYKCKHSEIIIPEACEWYRKGDSFRRLAFMEG